MPESQSKWFIINVDDLGMDYGGTEAFRQLINSGSVSSGSVMVPCPWFEQVKDLYKQNDRLNIGIHLTLTSEWSQYRWGPITTKNVGSGLIDGDGFFWKNRKLLRENINVKAAEVELIGQIDKALTAGLRPSHIDCHMGIGFIPELFEFYVELGNKYELPVLIPRKIEDVLTLYKIDESYTPYYKKIINKLSENKYVMADNFRITPCFGSNEALEGYKKLITKAENGITFLSIHANTPGNIQFIDPIKYQVRIDEYNIFKQYLNNEWMKSVGIKLINLKDLK